MGVPRLFNYIKNKFYKNLKEFYFGDFTTNVDYLYIDANGPLHTAAQFVFKYGDRFGKEIPLHFYSYEYSLMLVCEAFFQALIKVISIVKPTKMLYIAIDGTAPRPKQNQQRQRRFDNTKIPTEEHPFTSNIITTGTEFMANCTRYIQFAIRKLLNRQGIHPFQIIFSSHNEPGEGEHKIMDYIRALPNSEKTSQIRHCIYGPDADLIMLCLATHLPNIYLFKEDQFETDHYYYLNMSGVRRDLPLILRYYIPPNSPRYYYDMISDEFIIQGFFVGNDFLPKIQMFHKLEDGLIKMINTFSITSQKGTINRLVYKDASNKYQMNLKGFRLFVSKLEESEKSYLINQVTTPLFGKQLTDDLHSTKGVEYTNYTIKNNLSVGIGAISSQLNWGNFSRDYYLKANITTQTQIHQMCEDYVKAFLWIYIYYTKGCPAWRWAYTYHYAPLMFDLKAYLADLSEEQFRKLSEFDLGKPFLPFEQLIAVLPPTSKDLLPEEYQILFIDPNSPMMKAEYFPAIIKKDYEGKLKEHEVQLLLPFVDPSVVEESYLSVIAKRKYVRNTFESSALFDYDVNYTSFFISDKGNIPSCHVKKIRR